MKFIRLIYILVLCFNVNFVYSQGLDSVYCETFNVYTYKHLSSENYIIVNPNSLSTFETNDSINLSTNIITNSSLINDSLIGGFYNLDSIVNLSSINDSVLQIESSLSIFYYHDTINQSNNELILFDILTENLYLTVIGKRKECTLQNLISELQWLSQSYRCQFGIY